MITDNQNHVRIWFDEAGGISPDRIHVVRRPTLDELDIAAFGPTQPQHFLTERLNARLIGIVAFRKGHQDTDPPHARFLLRWRRQWPKTRTADQRNELAPLYVGSVPERSQSSVSAFAKSSKGRTFDDAR